MLWLFKLELEFELEFVFWFNSNLCLTLGAEKLEKIDNPLAKVLFMLPYQYYGRVLWRWLYYFALNWLHSWLAVYLHLLFAFMSYHVIFFSFAQFIKMMSYVFVLNIAKTKYSKDQIQGYWDNLKIDSINMWNTLF